MERATTSASSEGEFRFKVVLLGEGAVGKSSLMLRYVEDKFSPRHVSTIQASFLSKRLDLGDNHVDLDIWDTAGQEKYHALGPIYYRGSHGALLIYDITDKRSFEKVKIWVRELQRALGETAVLIVVGNKLDLESERTVDRTEAIQYAKSVNAEYVETSAKENLGLADLFEKISSLMIDKWEKTREISGRTSQNSSSSNGSRRGIQLVDEQNDAAQRTGKCCK
ncbi:unnamed protein product, partial [Mesorhabditis belari]|uniref:Ras-related protein Rab-21 n=1 Tax=Mesorhabditis belari TaxID=2138241 RepID=A0AAF3EN79_9BILA